MGANRNSISVRTHAPGLHRAGAACWHILRALGRPSFWLRGAWLGLALLHGWLIVRRLELGELAAFADMLRALLALAAVYYCTLKFWRVATVFDREPRRALVFALALLLGHVWLNVDPAAERQAAARPTVMLVLQMALPALQGAVLALALLGPLRGVLRRLAHHVRLLLMHLALLAAPLLARARQGLSRQLPRPPGLLWVSPLRLALPPPCLA